MLYEKNSIPTKNKPIIFSLLIILIYFLKEIAIFNFFKNYWIFNFVNNEYIFEIANSITNIALILLIVLLFKFWFIYSTKNFKQGFKQLAFFIFFYSIMFIYDLTIKIKNKENFKPSLGIIAGILDLFLTGFGEESIFRGIVANSIASKYAKNKAGIYFSVIVSGFLFGFAHIVNILSGVTILNGLMQIITASVIGMFLTAAYYKSKNIWPLIILHCAIDAVSLLNYCFVKNCDYVDIVNETLTSSDFIYFIINISIYFILTLFLLRNNKINEIINNFKPQNIKQ